MAFLLPLLGFLGKLIGVHLFTGATGLLSSIAGPAFGAVLGLGWRILVGIVIGLAIDNAGVRSAIWSLGKAIVGIVL